MKVFKTVFWVLLVMVLGGCATHNVNYSYKGHSFYSSEPQTKDYRELGQIAVQNYGFVWESCSSLAKGAYGQAENKVESMGGNALMNMRHECVTAYGWFAAYIVGGLGPWVKHVDVSGIAIERL